MAFEIDRPALMSLNAGADWSALLAIASPASVIRVEAVTLVSYSPNLRISTDPYVVQVISENRRQIPPSRAIGWPKAYSQ